MSENTQPVSRMRRIVNLLHDSKWARIVPVIVAAAMYLLFLIFGSAEMKAELGLLTPFIAFVAYWGIFFVVWVQVRNPMCPAGYLNFCLLLFTFFFTSGSLMIIVPFLADMSNGFSPMCCVGPLAWSALSLAHSKRKD